jgi:hypothetical protein
MMDLNTRTHLLEREAELEQIGDALRTAAAGSGRPRRPYPGLHP